MTDSLDRRRAVERQTGYAVLVYNPDPFNTSQRDLSLMRTRSGPRQRHLQVKGTSLVNEFDARVGEFEPEERFIRFRRSPTYFLCIGDVATESAGFVGPFNRSSKVVHVGQDGFFIPAQTRVGFDVPCPDAEHAHEEDAQQEREDVPQFSGRCPGVVNETLLLQTNTSRVVTSKDASCKVNSITSPLVCQTASDVP